MKAWVYVPVYYEREKVIVSDRDGISRCIKATGAFSIVNRSLCVKAVVLDESAAAYRVRFRDGSVYWVTEEIPKMDRAA